MMDGKRLMVGQLGSTSAGRVLVLLSSTEVKTIKLQQSMTIGLPRDALNDVCVWSSSSTE